MVKSVTCSNRPRLGRVFLAVFFCCCPALADGVKGLDVLVNEVYAELGCPSVSVGVVRGDELVYTRSLGLADRADEIEATPQTLYRIGSVTKVFTTTLLVDLRDDGVLRLDAPVDRFLPENVRMPSDPRGAPAITLRHLATLSSGLPRNPVNREGKPGDPWAGYSVDRLYEGLGRTRLTYPTGSRLLYSNLAMGLLGHALERAAGKPYDQLLRERVLEPLGMHRSRIYLDEAGAKALATGYLNDDASRPAVDWDLGCIAPAGGLASSVEEMARFLAFQLAAGREGVEPVSGGSLREMQVPQRVFDGWGKAVGLGWLINRDEEHGDIVWHNGGMDGFASWIGMSPEWNLGAIVLTNCGRSVTASGQQLLGAAIDELRRPDPALVKLAHSLVPHFDESPDDSLGDLFMAEFLDAIPLDSIKAAFAEVHQANGPCRGVRRVDPGPRPNRAKIIFDFDEGRSVECAIGVDTLDHPQITFLRLP